MRKAKVAAIIFGGVSTCILGGLVGVYATSPIVSSVAPKNDVENIYEVESEILANVAAVTSIRTTAVTTTSRNTTTSYSITTAVETASTTNTEAEGVSVDFFAKSPVIADEKPMATEPTTEAPTEPITEAPTEPVTEPATEAPTEAPTEPTTNAPEIEEPSDETEEPATEQETEVQQPEEEVQENALPISDEEFILLCNAVANEAGSNWISEYDKALVVEVIMNRVNSNRFPNTIYGVLTAPYQFTGAYTYVNLTTYSRYVTESVKNAVMLYFNETESFQHGYFYFHGDGYRNYFS